MKSWANGSMDIKQGWIQLVLLTDDGQLDSNIINISFVIDV